jgi:CDP-6-deoxy-D-xylo-4-hexulose-3-dehydrase
MNDLGVCPIPSRVTSLPDLKAQILSLRRDYARLALASHRSAADPARTPWAQGSPIPYAVRVFTEDEVEAAVSSILDFWLTLGSEGSAMEKELAAFQGVRHSLLLNSGSSANLVAISALTSAKLQ